VWFCLLVLQLTNDSIQAGNGQPGGSNMTGKAGDPIIVRVPTGTVVKELSLDRSSEVWSLASILGLA